MRQIKSFANDSAIQEAVNNKFLGKPYVALDDATGKIDWNGKNIDYSTMYLTIEALESGKITPDKRGVEYSVNSGEWIVITGNDDITLSQGDKVKFRGTSGGDGLFYGRNTLMFKVYGNIESLEYGDDFVGQTSTRVMFNGCFYGCTGLVDAENLVLPATTLTEYCYKDMFEDCTSLTTAPELPATTLTYSCYASMFQNCTSLTQAPELPAAILVDQCYEQMFDSCVNLNYIKCLATGITGRVGRDTTSNWVYGVSPTGTFVKKAGVNWQTGVNGIPDGWDVIEE